MACSELYGPEETPLTPDTAAGVQISISDVTDNSFKVTVTPSGESSYYSYLVDASDAAETLDPETLYKVGYKSVAQGTVEWTKDAPSYTFEVAAEPNTTYQVYAVAASLMGFAGDIAVTSVKTSDVVAPELTGFTASEEQVAFMLKFSEGVVPAGDITVRYFKRWTATNDISNDIEAGSVVIKAADVQANGNQAVVAVEGVPAGAYYTIAWNEGAFVDYAGNKLGAQESGFTLTETGSLTTYGLYGRAPFASFDVNPIEATSFAQYTTPFVTDFDTENAVMKGAAVEDETATAVYVLGGKTVSLELTYGQDYAFLQGYCVVYLPEEPERGAIATITIPAGTFTDEWGNTSNEFTHSAVYSYGYTLEDVVGHYVGEAVSYWDGPLPLSFTIAESDNPEYGNVMITESYMGFPCSAGNIYANFDFDGGTLTIESGQVFFVQGDNILFFAVNGADYVTLNMPESGVLTAPDAWFGAYFNGAGWYDAYTDCTVVKTTPAEGTAAAASVADLNFVGRIIR